MKESYGEILARYAGPESYADAGNSVGVATAGVRLGPEIESRNVHRLVCRPSGAKGRLHPVARLGESDRGHGGIYGPGMGGNSKRENRETLRRLSEEVADSGPETSQRTHRA